MRTVHAAIIPQRKMYLSFRDIPYWSHGWGVGDPEGAAQYLKISPTHFLQLSNYCGVFRKFFWLKGSVGILIDDEPWGTEIKVQKSRVNLSAQLSRSWCIANDVTLGACFESFTFLDLSSFLFHAFPGGRDNVGGLHAFGSSKEEEACPPKNHFPLD